MRRAAIAAALALAGCGPSLAEQRVQACTARARAAVSPAGFASADVEKGGETSVAVTFYTGDGSGASTKKRANCFFKFRSADMNLFDIADADD